MSAQPVIKPTPVRTVQLQPGFYRHYKGTLYRVLGTGWHSDTDEEFVLYHEAGNIDRMFTRPVTTFMEPVTIAETAQPRYAFVQAKEFMGDDYNG